MSINIINSDVVEGLRTLPDHSVHCVVTSPPYFGLRDYGIAPRKWADGSECVFGLEPSVELYIEHLVEIFSELKRVLHPSGTFWLNIGDCYNHAGPQPATGIHAKNGVPLPNTFKRTKTGRSKKNLAMVPARAALALQQDGWLLRQDNIWVKGCSFLPSFSGSVMPESIRDRTVWAHEHLFQFAQEHYVGPEKITMSEKDALWLAAMIDTEGSIGIQVVSGATKHPQFQIYVTFPNTSIDLVNKAKRLMNSTSHELEGTNFPLHVVRLNSRKAAVVLRTIRPHLIAKRLQCEVALACQFTVGPQMRDAIGRVLHDASRTAYRTKLHALCCALNQGERPDMNWVKWEPEGGYRDYSYYYDIDACREPYAESTRKEAATTYEGQATKDYAAAGAQDPSEVKRRVLASVARQLQRQDQGLVEGSASSRRSTGFNSRYVQGGSGRNLRNVWVIPKEPLKELHFAAFPTKLVEPVIQLATSEHGCCSTCLNPYERARVPNPIRGVGRTRRTVVGEGWRRTCLCPGDEVIPCTVLDPFNGSGRAGVVAQRLRRSYIGIDASEQYCDIARRVIGGVA